MEKMHLYVADGAKVPFHDPSDGALIADRFIARERRYPHVPLPDGEVVSVSAMTRTDILRAIAAGHLTITKPAPKSAAAKE